jgi:hypothetical protein
LEHRAKNPPYGGFFVSGEQVTPDLKIRSRSFEQ